jgi:hypothetical protein
VEFVLFDTEGETDLQHLFSKVVGHAPDVFPIPVAPSLEYLAEIEFFVFHNINFIDVISPSSMKQTQLSQGVGWKSLNGEGNDRCLFRGLTRCGIAEKQPPQ